MKKLILVPFMVFMLIACDDNKKDSASTNDPIINNAYIDDNAINDDSKSHNRTRTISDIEFLGEISELGIPAKPGGEVVDINGELVDINDFGEYDYDTKSGYSLLYRINERKEKSSLSVFVYKKNNNIAYFFYNRSSDDDLSKNRRCIVKVKGNTMTSEECGNKEGEVVNKILNAIENKTYFDY